MRGVAIQASVVLVLSLTAMTGAFAQCDFAKLQPSAPQSQARFGESVRHDDSTIVVGAPGEVGAVRSPSAGAVYVLDDVGGSWVESQRLALPAAQQQSGDRFGAAVDVSGDTLVVGVPGHGPGEDQGAAYVFTRNGGQWSLGPELTDGGAFLGAFDAFGTAVAIDGNIAVVGAPGNDAVATDAGMALVFVKCGATWCLQGVLVPYGGPGGDDSGAGFGSSVAISGDTIVVGGPRQGVVGGPEESAGAVWVFRWGGPLWDLQQVLDAGVQRQAHGRFGASVAIDGDALLVGAPGEGAGAAYVFVDDGVAWLVGDRLASGDGEDGDGFGTSVDLLNDVDLWMGTTVDVALVGAPDDAVDFVSGFRCGSTGLYVSLDGSSWTSVGRLTAFDTRTGEAYGGAACLGRGAVPIAVAAAPAHRDDLLDAGGVFVHELDVDCDGSGTPDVLDVAWDPATNANGNCVLDACETGPSFEPASFCEGTDDGAGPGSGATAHAGFDLSLYLGGLTSGSATLNFDDVPGENGLPATPASFAHTMTGLTSQLTGATLRIGVRATSHGSLDPSTDRIALEILDPDPAAPQSFHWESLLADLPEAPGGQWSRGDQVVFTFDLTALPFVGGGSANLLVELADGEIDILVDGNSGVDFLCLSLEHHKPRRLYIVRYDPDEGTPHSTIEAILTGLPEVHGIHASEDFLDRIDVLAEEEIETILTDAAMYPWFESLEIWPLVTGAAGESPCPCEVPPDEPSLPEDYLCQCGGHASACDEATMQQVIELIGVDALHSPPYGEVVGAGLTGAGVAIGLVDIYYPSHGDLCGRVQIADDQDRVGSHATTVAGILAGDGTITNGEQHGLAPEALVFAFSQGKGFDDFDNEIPRPSLASQVLAGIQDHGLSIFNVSWGHPKQCRLYGRYVLDCPDLDELARQMGTTIVLAAGNEQQWVPDPPGSQGCPSGPYGRMLPLSSAKNVITVGGLCASADSVPNRPSFGPTRDGRLKPDLVAISERISQAPFTPGAEITKLDAANVLCSCGRSFGLGATSWATPQVTGVVSLLAEANGGWIDPSLVRALLCNTASDVKSPGGEGAPVGIDFKTGYGLVDGEAAYSALASGRWLMDSVGASGDEDVYVVVIGGSGRILSVLPTSSAAGSGIEAAESTPGSVGTPRRCRPAFMIAWSDPECETDCDERDHALGGALVNDLDLWLESPSGERIEPWTLDPDSPASPATRKPNRRDNLEQVTLSFEEIEPGSWLLKVRGQEVTQGPQTYALTWASRCSEDLGKGAEVGVGAQPAPPWGGQ